MTIVGGGTWSAFQARRWARTGCRSGRVERTVELTIESRLSDT